MQMARLARYKQRLREAGESISMPKPSEEARQQKEEELKKLYLELVSKKEEPREEAEQAEQPGQEGPSEAEQQEQAEGTPETN